MQKDNLDIQEILKDIYIPGKDSHKGQNGRLLIIGGSHLFHAASLWSLKTASRIVDLVHYSSVEENNKIVQRFKEEFRDGIVVERGDIESYIEEDDCILIGPGMVRAEETYSLTKKLLLKYPEKRWVIDAGALQMMEPEWVPKGAILTPHHKEFENLKPKTQNSNLKDQIKLFAEEYGCIVLYKGTTDIVSDGTKTLEIKGGNAGMTKGGTGDVLAGLTAALFCKNDAFATAAAASYINKTAGDDLFEEKGLWFNASDLADQIPRTMKRLLL